MTSDAENKDLVSGGNIITPNVHAVRRAKTFRRNLQRIGYPICALSFAFWVYAAYSIRTHGWLQFTPVTCVMGLYFSLMFVFVIRAAVKN